MKGIGKGLFFIGLVTLLLVCPLWSGTTGKIAGIVQDEETGEPLIGANVVVSGTSLGAATDENGQYTILYVPPGVYEVQVFVIGYAKVTVSDVRVYIDQTARLDFELEIEEIKLGKVTITAERKVIKDDVATSVVAISSSELVDLPISSVQNIVELQAGIEEGFEIRGGGADEALFIMDGATLRDPRNNQPITSVALSSIKEISVERGGFNAEYGQVRSGIVNVITKEGSRTGYSGSLEFKYSPPGPKHFGISPFDENSFWLRPYYDDEVCWTGTSGEAFEDLNGNQFWDETEPYTDENGDGRWTGWDKYTQRQYPEFEGWKAVSERLLSDDDPTNDLSAYGCQQVFMYETRKQPALDEPDYNIDLGFGGPVPLISEKLGDLRFFSSFRKYREMLVVPLTRDDYVDWDWSIKVISDINPSMKLTFLGLIGKKYTMQENWSYNYLLTSEDIAAVIEDRPGRLFGTGHFSLSDIGHRDFSAKFTHILNDKTFYELSLENMNRNYYTRPTTARDKTTLYEIVDGYYMDEAPFNWDYDDEVGIAGMLFGGFTSKRRDNTNTSSTTLKMDLSSQINFNNLVKTGFEIVYNDLDFDYGIQASYSDDRYEEHVQLHVKPIRTALYVQDKLERKGFIMNLGLRFDYSSSNTEWWDVDPYHNTFFTAKYSEDQNYTMEKTRPQWQLSPRLGISHPITENSKFFFNYGHFKQMPSYETLFWVGRATDHRVTTFGDPSLTLAKTISYELGYDQSLFNSLLIQLSAFYHDIFDQQDSTKYTSIGGIEYYRTSSNSYEDIRGFEISMSKKQGRWWSFFANYTYQVSTSGHFGRGEIYEDPTKQKEYDEATTNLYQERPTPSPYTRLNLTLFTPDDFGPTMLGMRPMGGYLLNFLVNWQAGDWVTWNPKGIQAIENNVQETDYFNTVLRFGKTFRLNKVRIQAFVDIDNLFDYRRMSMSNLEGKEDDHDYYFYSLHLPESEAYDNIPGNDRVGSYRKSGVDYQPMFWRGKIDYENDVGESGVIYYDKFTEKYVQYYTGEEDPWVEVETERLNQILEDKAYIDMPNQDSFTFFNPRQVFFGIRMSFDLD